MPITRFRRWHLISAVGCAAVALLNSCKSAGPERPTRERRIECEAPGETLQYEAAFHPGKASNPVDTVTVTFRAKKPTSTEAEGVLRRCLQQATTVVRIDYETLANTWFNDDGPLPLIDGSSHLSYDPKTGKVQTWNEREGVKPMEAKRDGYTVSYQEDKIAVRPYGKFATIEVLFQKAPGQAEILKILATEVATAVSKQPTKLNTTAYAKTGPPNDRAAQEQIRGSSGVFLKVEFDAKSGRMRDQDSRVVQTIK
jgi:hypothetical protein